MWGKIELPAEIRDEVAAHGICLPVREGLGEGSALREFRLNSWATFHPSTLPSPLSGEGF